MACRSSSPFFSAPFSFFLALRRLLCHCRASIRFTVSAAISNNSDYKLGQTRSSTFTVTTRNKIARSIVF